MERIGASKFTSKKERNHSFWKFSGEKTEKFNGSKCYGGRHFPDMGNLQHSKAKEKDTI